MPSTVIRAFAYDPARGELSITFQSGKRYRYLEVPEAVFVAMQAALSKGDFFNDEIREQFAFVRDESDPSGAFRALKD